jgi:hypothetical protein
MRGRLANVVERAWAALASIRKGKKRNRSFREEMSRNVSAVVLFLD